MYLERFIARVTVDLVRKRAEHHDKQLAPLCEISLHQEGIEKIEHIQQWCPKLQILLLQSNIISTIENVNKLKELEYLNLAINNIERIENLEKCESLKKLDLTLNFIGDLTSIENLKDNYNLQILYLVGNPCSDYEGYREYTIATLQQINNLDGEEIKISERIIAQQKLNYLTNQILKQQDSYFVKRKEQKKRLKQNFETKWKNIEENDDDNSKRFWNEKCEHSPEVRIEIEKFNEIKRNKRYFKENVEKKRNRPLFSPDGRPYNINEAKLEYHFYDENPNYFQLEIYLFKYLDTSLINVDVQPFYVCVTVKEKLFQICLPDEISIEKSSVKRSQITGHLSMCLIKLKAINITNMMENKFQDQIRTTKDVKTNSNKENNQKRELLEIGPSKNVFDFTAIDPLAIDIRMNTQKPSFIEKIPPFEFIDNPEVPPLI